MANIKLTWYHLAIPILVIIFSPIMLLSFRPHVSYDIAAVPAEFASISSPISPVFSRAPFFVIYDFKHNTVKYVAHLLVRERAGIVIGKNVGPEPFEHLMRRGVRVYAGLANTVQEALFKYSTNQLMQTSGPTGFSKVFIR
jgi:predicted Fe-Mo cluster-binding NifX family protein